jgi:citrate synthase
MDPSRQSHDGADGWMTADQVADALSVKRATVYAYVSRGLLHRTVALDGRTSLFERRQVEDLRVGRRSGAAGELRTILSTAITRITEGTVLIRGRDLVEEIDAGAGFAVVADLIWETDNTSTWADLFGRSDRPPSPLLEMDLAPLDRLRVAVAVASSQDPFRLDLSPAVVRRTGPRLIKAMIDGLPVLGKPAPKMDQPVAEALWRRLTERRPTPGGLRCLDAALALLADHGLASSTFAARVAASTRADPYAVVGAGLGALGGPLHGAASAGVHRALQSLESGRPSTDGLVPWSPTSGPMAGFGHTIYRTTDPRFGLLIDLIRSAWADDPRLELVDRYRQMVAERTEAAPNIDLALGLLTFMADMDADAGEVIFAVSRTAGWIGHAMEEYQERPLRLRPKGHYVGPLDLTGP